MSQYRQKSYISTLKGPQGIKTTALGGAPIFFYILRPKNIKITIIKHMGLI